MNLPIMGLDADCPLDMEFPAIKGVFYIILV
nr:MAG TPA_asm: hypothetical protein [Caudoviricetes sp.]